MATTKATLGQRLGAAAYQVFCLLLRIQDIRLVAIIGRGIGYLAWALLPSRRKIVARNLRIAADPTLKGAQLAKMVRQNIVRTCMNMACTFKTGLMTDKEFSRAVTVEGAQQFEKMAAEGNCVIGCIPHAGNWEVLARIRPLFPSVKRFGSMYRRLDNPVLEDIVYRSRTRYGCEMFASQKGLKEVFRLAKDGGMLGVLSDQFTQQGIFLPYFGKVTGTTPLPSLIYKRCKERGHLIAASTRNTGLGKWEAVLSREIQAPANADSIPAVTMAVNLAIEEAQKESILDGFWMHHRWKTTYKFAPNVDDETNELIRQHARLPFRIIICVPEAFEEALMTIQMMRELRQCRPDMQLTVLCPEEQKAFWQTQDYISYVVTSEKPLRQLEADELYKDGPYDYIFMLSENGKVLKELKKLAPIAITGFADNTLGKKIRYRYHLPSGAAPHHRALDYIRLGADHISVCRNIPYADKTKGNADASGYFISPFSTLGTADQWDSENWKMLIAALNREVTLIAFEQHRQDAENLAADWQIPCKIVTPETVASVLGAQCRLYAVDGLMPQLAALVGCECRVIMSSRLAAVYAPIGAQHKTYTNHTPCHPCYRGDCDQATPCSAGVSVDKLLA